MAFPIRGEIQYGHVSSLYRTAAHKGRTIHLVVDNAPWHKTKALRKRLGEITHLIEVHFLPKYSPKLNLAEYISKETRKWAVTTVSSGRSKTSKESLFRRFNRVQGSSWALKSIVPYFA